MNIVFHGPQITNVKYISLESISSTRTKSRRSLYCPTVKMLPSYPRPPPFTWPLVVPRTLLPVYPSQPSSLPALPSLPRQPSFGADYTLTTHLFPAAHLRTTQHIPIPAPPPETYNKAERQAFFARTRQHLRDVRVSTEPQGAPEVLWNCVNRYVRKDLGNRGSKGLTLFFAHANGFPKEVSSGVL